MRQFGKVKGTHVGSDEGTVTFTSAHTERYDGIATSARRHAPRERDVRLIVGGGIRIPSSAARAATRRRPGCCTSAQGENRALNVYRITLPANVA